MDVEKLNENQYLYFKVEGVSMSSTLQNGDIAYVRHVGTSNINIGDIIIYRTLLSKEVIHRVIKKINRNGRQIFITKGDNNVSLGEYVYLEDILYKVIFIERKGRRIKLNEGLMRLKAMFYTYASVIEICICSILKNIRYGLRCIILGKVLQKLQGFKIYNLLSKIYIDKNKVYYRFAEPDDAVSLARLYRNYYWPSKLETLTEIFNKSVRELGDYGCYLLAQIENNIVGSIIVKRFSDKGDILSGWWIYNFYIDWRHRNIGIENQLIKLAIERAKRQSATEIKILIPMGYSFAVNLFRNLYGAFIQSYFDKYGSFVFTLNLN